LISQLKLQLNQRADTLLDIKREHADLQINDRKLVSDLIEKDRELKAIQDDFDKTIDENRRYKVKLSEE